MQRISHTLPADQYPLYLVEATTRPAFGFGREIGGELKTHRGAFARAARYAALHPDHLVRVWGLGKHRHPDGALTPNWYVAEVFKDGAHSHTRVPKTPE